MSSAKQSSFVLQLSVSSESSLNLHHQTSMRSIISSRGLNTTNNNLNYKILNSHLLDVLGNPITQFLVHYGSLVQPDNQLFYRLSPPRT